SLPEAFYTGALFSPGDDLLVTVGDGEVRFWRMPAGDPMARLRMEGREDPEQWYNLRLDKRGRLLVFTDRWLRIHAPADWSEVFVFRFGPEDWCLDLAETNDGIVAITTHQAGGRSMSSTVP